MDPVRNLLNELQHDPTGFRENNGYERLLELLWAEHPAIALKEALRGDEILGSTFQ